MTTSTTQATKTARKPRSDKGQPRAPRSTPEQIAVAAKNEKARKAASKKALHAALKAKSTSSEPVLTQAQPVEPDAQFAARQAEYAKNAREAIWLDFCAEKGVDPQGGDPVRSVYGEEFATYLAAQGFNPDGTPNTGLPGTAKPRYNGPMLALRRAAVNYVKPANGNPCNGDELATLLGELPRERVVRVLLGALGLSHNPYVHLNPGQQSMNLRNKARHAVKDGLITLAVVRGAIAANP
jgi:hypothetical protein